MRGECELRGHYIKQFPWTPTQRRGYIDAEFETPGPAAIALRPSFGTYTSEGTIANAPSYTFGSKHEEKDYRTKPGPADYTVEDVTHHGKNWSRSAHISPKLKDPEPFKTPSPTAYEPLMNAVKPLHPSYSFGEKIANPIPFNTPSPSAYEPLKSMNAVKRLNPSYTFGEKITDPAPFNTPSPSAYEPLKSMNAIKPLMPAYSFGEKIMEPAPFKTPAPTDYEPEKVWVTKPSEPRFTFGVKHSKFAHTLS